jgi:hypothetical protein
LYFFFNSLLLLFLLLLLLLLQLFHFLQGCVFERSGDKDLAGKLFGAALEKDESYGAAWNNWGFVREEQGDVEGAEVDWE